MVLHHKTSIFSTKDGAKTSLKQRQEPSYSLRFWLGKSK